MKGFPLVSWIVTVINVSCIYISVCMIKQRIIQWYVSLINGMELLQVITI
jgi:hypothetical protein